MGLFFSKKETQKERDYKNYQNLLYNLQVENWNSGLPYLDDDLEKAARRYASTIKAQYSKELFKSLERELTPKPRYPKVLS